MTAELGEAQLDGPMVCSTASMVDKASGAERALATENGHREQPFVVSS